MLIETYTKQQLKNNFYETAKIELEVEAKYLSDWLVDYMIQNNRFVSLQDQKKNS